MDATVEMLEQLLAEVKRDHAAAAAHAVFLLRAETQLRILGGERGDELQLQGEVYAWAGIPLVISPELPLGSFARP